MTLFTENEFSFEKIVPADGSEPPGNDPRNAPRPPGGKRVFSASVDATPFGVYVFRSTEPAAKVVDYYDKEMTDRDWLRINAPVSGGEGRTYAKLGEEISIHVGSDEEGTIMSIAEATADRSDFRKSRFAK
jgi:hypothetical protein